MSSNQEIIIGTAVDESTVELNEEGVKWLFSSLTDEQLENMGWIRVKIKVE